MTAAIPRIPRSGAGTVIYGRVSRRRRVDSITDAIVATFGGSDSCLRLDDDGRAAKLENHGVVPDSVNISATGEAT